MPQDLPSAPAQAAYQAHFHNNTSTSGLLCIHLTSRASQTLTSSGLERLARDETFGWARSVKIRRQNFMRKEPDSPLSSTLTSTQVTKATRSALRARHFDLTSSGAFNASDGASPGPPGFGDTPMTAPFHEVAVQVDAFLLAVDRLRRCDHDRLRTLFIERAGWTESWSDLHCELVSLFGMELEADFVVITVNPIGPTLTNQPREEIFNSALDESVISAVNSILCLTGMASNADEGSQQGGPSAATEADAAARDEDGEDLAAARLLVRALLRKMQGRFLRLVQPLTKDSLPRHLAAAWINTRPDWVLLNGLDDSCEIFGVVESKPRSSLADLQRLTARRIDPLGPEHGEHDELRPATTRGIQEAATVQGGESLRRSRRIANSDRSDGSSDGVGAGTVRSRPNYLDRADTPENVRRRREVASHPHRGPEYGYVTAHDWQKLQLQLASQMLFHNVRHGLVWGGWSSSLVVAQMTKLTVEDERGSDGEPPRRRLRHEHGGSSEAGGPARFDLSFAVNALHAPISAPPPPAPLASSSVSEGASTGTPAGPLVFRSGPNVVLGLVQWALHAHRDRATRGPLLPDQDRIGTSEAPSAPDDEANSGGGEPPETPDLSPRKGRRGGGHKRPRDGAVSSARDGPQLSKAATLGSPPSPASSRRSIPGSGSLTFSSPRSVGSGPGTCVGTPPTSPDEAPKPHVARRKESGQMRVELMPFAQGTFADVYQSRLAVPGQPDRLFVYKINRPTRDEAEDDVQSGALAARNRFEYELALLKDLEHLQGGILPRVWGISDPSRILALPEGSSKALILEDVGFPIDYATAWPTSMPLAERRRLVEEAYATLHDAGLCHGDVAPRNVLVSCPSSVPRGKPETDSPLATTVTIGPPSSSSSPSDLPAARVCIVDLTEAYHCRPGIPSEEEAARLKEMLDRLFRPRRKA